MKTAGILCAFLTIVSILKAADTLPLDQKTSEEEISKEISQGSQHLCAPPPLMDFSEDILLLITNFGVARECVGVNTLFNRLAKDPSNKLMFYFNSIKDYPLASPLPPPSFIWIAKPFKSINLSAPLFTNGYFIAVTLKDNDHLREISNMQRLGYLFISPQVPFSFEELQFLSHLPNLDALHLPDTYEDASSFAPNLTPNYLMLTVTHPTGLESLKTHLQKTNLELEIESTISTEDLKKLEGLPLYKLKINSKEESQVNFRQAFPTLNNLEIYFTCHENALPNIRDLDMFPGCLESLALRDNSNFRYNLNTLSTFKNLTNLTLSMPLNLEDFASIVQVTFLKSLDVNICHLTTIDTLKDLSHLKKLILRGARNIKHIKALYTLKVLEDFYLLDYQYLEDIKPLSTCSKLKTLYISPLSEDELMGDETSNLHSAEFFEPIQDLLELRYLVIDCLGMHLDLNILTPLRKLVLLYIGQAPPLTSYKRLERCSSLKNLKISFQNKDMVPDVSSLSGLTQLSNLTIMQSSLGDLSFLEHFISLQELHLFNLPALRDITSLKKLPLLRRLTIDVCPQLPLETIPNLLKLTYLKLGDVKLYKEFITKLKDLEKLKYLDVKNYPGYSLDLSCFSGLTQLYELSICYQNINPLDLTDLLPLEHLRKLYVSSIHLHNPLALLGLKHLREVKLPGYNATEDIKAQFKEKGISLILHL